MSADSPAKTPEDTQNAESRTFLSKVVNSLNKVVTPTSLVFVSIGGAVVTAMMFLTLGDVSLRYLLNRPILGSGEITEFMMAVMVTLGLGYCALRKGHIRVDLVLNFISKRANRVLDILAYSVSAIFYIIVSWQVFLNAKMIMDAKLISSVLYIPVSPFAFVTFVGAALLVLVFIKDATESINEVMKKWNRLP